MCESTYIIVFTDTHRIVFFSKSTLLGSCSLEKYLRSASLTMLSLLGKKHVKGPSPPNTSERLARLIKRFTVVKSWLLDTNWGMVSGPCNFSRRSSGSNTLLIVCYITHNVSTVSINHSRKDSQQHHSTQSCPFGKR